VVGVHEDRRELHLEAGLGQMLDVKGLTRVAVGNSDTADVAPLSRSELFVTAKAAGETSIIIWDKTGRTVYRVLVTDPVQQPAEKANLEPAAERLRKALGDPAIRITAVGETLILEGIVDDEAASTRAEKMASALADNVENLIQVKPLERAAAELRKALADPAIRVTVARDTLLLEGTVADAASSTRAEKLASALTDNVQNLIEVKPPLIPDDSAASQLVARTLNAALKGSGVSARATTDDTVLVEGSVPSKDAERIAHIIETAGGKVTLVDAVKVVPQPRRQVLIRARVVEISHSRLKDLGVDWGQINGGAVVDQPFLFGLLHGGINRLSPFGARLDLLVTDNAARILSEPNLLALEDETATMLVGGEFAVPVLQAQGLTGGAVSVDYKEYGVKLTVTPTDVNDDGLTLAVAPEVSDLDLTNIVEASGISLPSLKSRKAETTVRIAPGSTLAIGGLLQNNESRVVQRIPVLSRIPVLGELFKSKSIFRDTTELVILITPEIVPADGSPAAGLAKDARKWIIQRPIVPGSVRPSTPPDPLDAKPVQPSPPASGSQTRSPAKKR
jgi:Flp pilus assembly secretin CpaC